MVGFIALRGPVAHVVESPHDITGGIAPAAAAQRAAQSPWFHGVATTT